MHKYVLLNYIMRNTYGHCESSIFRVGLQEKLQCVFFFIAKRASWSKNNMNEEKMFGGKSKAAYTRQL